MSGKFWRKVAVSQPRMVRAAVAAVAARAGFPVFPIPTCSSPTFRDWASSASAADQSGVRLLPAHPSEPLRRAPPEFFTGPQLHPAFAAELERESPATFVVEIPNGRVWSDTGQILMPDGAVLREMSPDFHASWRKDKIFRQSHLSPPESRSGRIVSLASPGGQTFGHWLFDCLPRLAVLERAGIDLTSCDGFYLSETRKKFQSQTLELLGIPERQWISAADTVHLRAETLVATSPVGVSGNYPHWVCEWLREKFLPLAESVPAVSRRIFISRSNAPGRRIANEEELSTQLERKGFQRVLLENYSFRQQIGIMAQAEFVVGPMGSSTSAAVFCQPNTPFIETYSSRAVNVFTWAFGTHLPLRFGYLLGMPVPQGNVRSHDEDYRIDSDELAALIQGMEHGGTEDTEEGRRNL